MQEIKRIEFDGDFELFERNDGHQIFDCPVLYIPENGSAISMNRAARDLIPENTTKMFMISFLDYIAILPDDHKTAGKNLFSFRRKNGAICYPASVKAKKIKSGYYQLYQYRNGIAFNRNERMDRNGNIAVA